MGWDRAAAPDGAGARGLAGVGAGDGDGAGAEHPAGTEADALPGAGVGASRRVGAGAGGEPGALGGSGNGARLDTRTAGGAQGMTEADAVDGPGDGDREREIPLVVREFVRELLREAEDALQALPADGEARIEVLAVAADAAARFDAELAGRLLADAESAAWTGPGSGGVDRARVARLLTGLAKGTAPHAPVRARRLLTDAQQALFTVFGSNRTGPLGAVAEELARVAPEQAAQIAENHFTGTPAENRIRSRIDTAVMAARPGEAAHRLARIQDPGRRAAATYDLVLAVAPHDLDAALRLSELIGSGGGRLLALCQVAHDRAEAGDPAGGARALAQAEEELPRYLEERAAWLREEAAQEAEKGRPVRAELLRTQAAGLPSRHLEEAGEAGDEKARHALSSLAGARTRVERANRPPLDPAVALERADRARGLPDPAERARVLARTARECVAAHRTPWLAEAAADAGSAPTHRTTALDGPDSGPAVAPGAHVRLIGAQPTARPSPPRAAPGTRAWHTGVKPDALYAAGTHVVWRSGTEVGYVQADAGTTRWTAHADEGTNAAPLPGSGRLLVSCLADATTVYVQVRRDLEPGARLVAREPHDGRVRWWRDLPSWRPLRTAGPVLVHGAPGDLTALWAPTGEVLWRRALRDTTTRLPASAGNRLVLADDRELQGLDLSTGRQVWSQRRSRPAEGVVKGQPVHLLDGTWLVALDRDSGREMWRYGLGAPAERLLIEGDTVFAAAYRPEQGVDLVVALDARTGALRWLRSLTRRGGPACALELLGLRPGGLYVKASGGGRRWRLIGPDDPFIAVLDPATGKRRRLWEDLTLTLTLDDVLLVAGHLVVSRPSLSAWALP
ncbi:PQQ-binding-like beta-propeller repeat protein [Streptomyces sp. NPDC006544]|uniref:PQQ-binding-like beta-propeller repeat protein n=1 Tax=Streptomyces sp. NPDC006544 TaxID=3154583 RepID=UPI0033A48C3D